MRESAHPGRPVACVVLYSAPGCPGSEAARAYFRRHGVPYVERDVSRDPAASDYPREALGVFATPCIEVNGQVLVGFDPLEFARRVAPS